MIVKKEGTSTNIEACEGTVRKEAWMRNGVVVGENGGKIKMDHPAKSLDGTT
jgi:hypothetical protein